MRDHFDRLALAAFTFAVLAWAVLLVALGLIAQVAR